MQQSSVINLDHRHGTVPSPAAGTGSGRQTPASPGLLALRDSTLPTSAAAPGRRAAPAATKTPAEARSPAASRSGDRSHHRTGHRRAKRRGGGIEPRLLGRPTPVSRNQRLTMPRTLQRHRIRRRTDPPGPLSRASHRMNGRTDRYPPGAHLGSPRPPFRVAFGLPTREAATVSSRP